MATQKSQKVYASFENVERISETLLGSSSAYQKGIFHYTSEYIGQSPVSVFIHFEVLLTKSNGIWKILMEYQKDYATKEDWNRLE